jgi:hypothetical protein
MIDFLQDGRIILFKSRDLFEIKEKAMYILAFGLGKFGVELFNRADFIEE